MFHRCPSVQQLVDRLNASPEFAAAFSVAMGNHDHSATESVQQANIVISAKAGGAGAVTVSGIPSDTGLMDQILAQASTAMLAQANQAPQSILKLLPNGS